MVLAVEAVEVGDGHAQIRLLAVRTGSLELSDQVLQRLFQHLRTSLVRAGNFVSCHGGRGIQHDDNVSALLDGHAGGGQLHLGDTGSLEVDAGTGLVDLHGALIGILGVVIDNTGFHLDLDSAQHLALIADLHPVGAGGVTVEGVLPLPGQIGVSDLGLAVAVGISSGKAGDTGLDSSQRLGSGAALRHGVNGVALDQRIDRAGRGAAGSAGVLIQTDTGRSGFSNSPFVGVDNVPVGAVNIVNIVDTIAVVIHLELNGISGTVTDTVVLLIQVLGSVTLGNLMVCLTLVCESIQNMVLIITSSRSCSVAADGDGVRSTVGAAVGVQHDGFVVIDDDVLVLLTVFDAVGIQRIGILAAGGFGLADVGPVGVDTSLVLDIDLDLDGAQRGTVLQDLHSVGAGVGAVVLVDPVPDDIVIGDSSLARALGIISGVNGDTGLDSSHGVGLGGVHVHQIQAVALGSVVGGRSGNHDLGGAELVVCTIVGIRNLNCIIAGNTHLIGVCPFPLQRAIINLGPGNIGARCAHGFIDIAVDAALDQSHGLLGGRSTAYGIGQLALDLAIGAVGGRLSFFDIDKNTVAGGSTCQSE